MRFAVFAVLAVFAVPAAAQWSDSHSVEALTAALTSPLSAAAIDKARAFDDELLRSGELDGLKVYLATGERSARANAIVKRLLEAAGQEPSAWVVRVLEPERPVVNAFVYGGRYLYVYTPLIDEAESLDELAFVLAHELGHSLLKHAERAREDATNTLSTLAALAALASKSHRDDLLAFAGVTKARYSRGDEEEADAIAAAIAHRAGFDPLRGAGFFSRQERKQDESEKAAQQSLAKAREEVLAWQASCKEWRDWYNASIFRRSQANADKVNGICAEAERRRVAYNAAADRQAVAGQEARVAGFFASHPANNDRVAAIAAVTDYLAGRRELGSLAKYEQSYRVMLALHEVESVLLKPTPE